MTIQLAEIIMNSVTIGATLLSVVFALGVVWRVEKELDISFKLFSCSIISFLIGEFVSFFQIEGKFSIEFTSILFKLLFAVFFLFGIFTMRDLLRKMDGEKNRDAILDDVYKDNPRR
jgi:hypothetical protein